MNKTTLNENKFLKDAIKKYYSSKGKYKVVKTWNKMSE